MGSLAGLPFRRVSSSACGPVATKLRPWKPERLPRRERRWAAGPFGLLRLGDAGPGGGVLRLEHPVRAGQEATDQHTVDQRDRQHHDDRGADEQRHLVVQVPAPDEEPGHRLDHVEQHPRRPDAHTTDQHGDDQRAHVAQRVWALHAHHRRHLPLPRGRRDQHQHTCRRRHRDGDCLQHIQHPLRRRPPRRAAVIRSGAPSSGEHADAVADRRIEPADEPLEQPVARQQRRGQRQAEEQCAERHPDEVEVDQAPRPDE